MHEYIILMGGPAVAARPDDAPSPGRVGTADRNIVVPRSCILLLCIHVYIFYCMHVYKYIL